MPLGITIDAGDGADGVFGTFDGHSVFDMLMESGHVELNGLTLTGGDAPPPAGNGGAISFLFWGDPAPNEGLTLKHSVITGNANYVDGGGIWANGNLRVDNCTISGNMTGIGNGGGIAFIGGYGNVLDLVSSTISGNKAQSGGGIHAEGELLSVNIEFSIIIDNEAGMTPGPQSDGGGIYFFGKNLTLQSSTISDNDAGGGGGGVYASVSNGSIIIDESTLSLNATTDYNTLGAGAFLSLNNSSMTIDDTDVLDNEALGPEANVGGLTVKAENNSNILMDGLKLIGNHADDDVGGLFIYNNDSTITVRNTTISANTAHQNSALSQNAAGGVWIQAVSGAQTTIESSTISGNKISTPLGGTNYNAYGGGLFIQGGAGTTTNVRNSTISGNEAEGNGGGIKIAEHYSAPRGGQVSIHHCTITNNRADSDNDGIGTGGGIHVGDSTTTVTLDHTIVAGNFRGSGSTRDDIKREITAAAITAAWSLIGDNTGANLTNNGGNQIGTSSSPINPLLGALQNNGGPTMTHSLLADSPAIDAGNPAAAAGQGGVPTFDQRGTMFPRVFNVPGYHDPGNDIDIGAYEIGLPKVIEVIVSDSTTTPHAHAPHNFASVVGDGDQLRTVPVGNANRIEIRFSEVVALNNPSTDVRVQIANTSTYLTGTVTHNGNTTVWTRNLGMALPSDQLILQIDDTVSGLGGFLDGNWTNPTSLNSSGTSKFPSGDGTAGGDFNFYFTILSGDFTHDNIVNSLDYVVWAKFQQTLSGAGHWQGDADGDGDVDFTDYYSFWWSQFGTNFTQWPT